MGDYKIDLWANFTAKDKYFVVIRFLKFRLFYIGKTSKRHWDSLIVYGMGHSLNNVNQLQYMHVCIFTHIPHNR